MCSEWFSVQALYSTDIGLAGVIGSLQYPPLPSRVSDVVDSCFRTSREVAVTNVHRID
jgi:hypothetical protein